MKKYILATIVAISLIFCGFVLAQGETVIPNPIPHDTFEELINAVFDWILNIALVLMPLLLVWGGVTFITASGDPGKVEKGKKIILWTLVGLLIVLLSKSLVGILQDLVESPAS